MARVTDVDQAAVAWRSAFFAEEERIVRRADALVLLPGEPPPYREEWTLSALGDDFKDGAFDFDLGIQAGGVRGSSARDDAR